MPAVNEKLPVLTAAFLTITKIRKQPKRPTTEEQVKKLRHIQTTEYYSAMKKNAKSYHGRT